MADCGCPDAVVERFKMANHLLRLRGPVQWARSATVLSVALLFVLVVCRPTVAGHYSPSEPMQAGGNYSHEDHSLHIHAGDFLAGVNLSSANLSEANFSFAVLSIAVLTSANFDMIDLTGANLQNPFPSEAVAAVQLRAAASLVGVNLGGNDLSGFDLSGIDMNSVNLFGANLSGANVSNTNFTNADLRNPDQARSIADSQMRVAASLALANLRGNDLSGFDLSGINLNSVNFSLADFSGADLTSADLGDTDLRNETVAEAISDSQLRFAANVTGANLSGNDLNGYDLSGIDLSSVDFSFSDLATTQFTSFPFGDAELSDANLHMAVLPPSMPSLPVISDAEVLVNSPLDVTGVTAVDADGLLSIAGTAFSTAGLDVGGPVQVSDGVLAAGTLTGEGVITLDALSQLKAGGNVDSIFGGFITGSGSVAKHGIGQFTLGRNNGYSGGTSVVEGTLLVDALHRLGHGKRHRHDHGRGNVRRSGHRRR